MTPSPLAPDAQQALGLFVHALVALVTVTVFLAWTRRPR